VVQMELLIVASRLHPYYTIDTCFSNTTDVIDAIGLYHKINRFEHEFIRTTY